MRLLTRIDPHVVWLLIMLVPLSLFWLRSLWVVLPVVMLPQGILLTHFADKLRGGHKADARAYFLVNQLLILFVVALAVALTAVMRPEA